MATLFSRRAQRLVTAPGRAPSLAAALRRCSTDASGHHASPASVSIGGVLVPLRRPLHPELVGFPNLWMLPGGPESAETAGTLRWLAQKQALRQDAMLLGDCIPTLRALALRFCQLTGREVELVSLSRDTTESDLKQRREISQATVKYSDQPVVQERSSHPPSPHPPVRGAALLLPPLPG